MNLFRRRRTPLRMIQLLPNSTPQARSYVPPRTAMLWRVVDFILDGFLIASISFLAGWHLFNRLF